MKLSDLFPPAAPKTREPEAPTVTTFASVPVGPCSILPIERDEAGYTRLLRVIPAAYIPLAILAGMFGQDTTTYALRVTVGRKPLAVSTLLAGIDRLIGHDWSESVEAHYSRPVSNKNGLPYAKLVTA